MTDTPAGQPEKPRFLSILGPGLITGASDDDPSGIATYSQAGAGFGYSLAWTLILAYPLMAGIQEISARLGRVTGHGIAGNIRRHYPVWLLYGIVGLLMTANTINLGADLGAMAAALKLLIGGPAHVYVVIFGVLSVTLEIFVHYERYAKILRVLTLSLFAYVATVFAVHVPWGQVAQAIVLPKISLQTDYIVALVAVFGTTISPYLFFWQSGQEVEKERDDPDAKPLKAAPEQAPGEIQRIRLDTYIGMAFANLVALSIVITTAATLNAHGITDIQTSEQAAEALRPIAGVLAFAIFAAGIIGTGLLALPVLAGSAAYALCEAIRRPAGLRHPPLKAITFYAAIAVATVIGIILNFTSIDPIKALFWSAVINGVVASPVAAVMMLLSRRPAVMGEFTLPTALKVLGWLTTATMALAVLAMVATWVM